MRKLFKYAVILMGFVFINPLAAQKFGYVDTQEIIEQLPEVKEANSNIETFKSQLQSKGQDMLKALQAKFQDLTKRQQQGDISPVQVETEAAKLKEEENKILLFEQESQQKIIKKSEDLLRPIRDRIQKAIDDVAAENGFTYIFDYSTGLVLYGDESANVMSLVKAKLGL